MTSTVAVPHRRSARLFIFTDRIQYMLIQYILIHKQIRKYVKQTRDIGTQLTIPHIEWVTRNRSCGKVIMTVDIMEE